MLGEFCSFCKKESISQRLHLHERVCSLNPANTHICPVCKKEFFCYPHAKRGIKKTCGKSCANKYFRSGEKSVNYLPGKNRYIEICFRYHEKKCVVCGELKIVSVHHYDEDHENNSPENLIPICPTHHFYAHSKYCLEVLPHIKEYRDQWIKKNS